MDDVHSTGKLENNSVASELYALTTPAGLKNSEMAESSDDINISISVETRSKLNEILNNLIPEDKQTFLQELGQECLRVLLGEQNEIKPEFWDEWYDVAEFQKNTDSLCRIDQMVEAYKSDKAGETLTMEELCRISSLNR